MKANIYSEKEIQVLAISKSNDPKFKNAYAQILIEKKDYSNSIKWFKLAAKEGNRDAMFNLAMIYHDGTIVRKDWIECEKWLKMAADLGDDTAIELLNDYSKW